MANIFYKMLGFDKALKKQLNTLISSTFATVNNPVANYPEWSTLKFNDTYVSNIDVFSIIRKIATTAATVPLYAYEVKKDEETKALRQFKAYNGRNIKERQAIKTKALEDLPDNDELNKLLDNPNPDQTKAEFMEALHSFILLFGEAFIWKFRLEGGANGGKVKYLYLWNPANVVIKTDGEYPVNVSGYEFIFNGKVVKEVPVEDVIHIKNYNPDQSLTGSLHGLSPLKAASKTITRIDSANDAAVAQMQNGGLAGIVYNEDINSDETGQEELDGMRDAFYKATTGTKNAGKMFFAAGKVGYTATGLKLADMDLQNSEIRSFKRLCNVYGISDILFNSDTASTESNVQEMIKQLYTNVVLPKINIVRDKLNAGLASEFTDKKRFIDCDISGITELQDDMKDLATVWSTMPVMKPNDILEQFKYEKSEDPLMEKYFIKQGYVPIEEAGLPGIQDEQALNDNSLNDYKPKQ